jgi:hypothetical protein
MVTLFDELLRRPVVEAEMLLDEGAGEELQLTLLVLGKPACPAGYDPLRHRQPREHKEAVIHTATTASPRSPTSLRPSNAL